MVIAGLQAIVAFHSCRKHIALSVADHKLHAIGRYDQLTVESVVVVGFIDTQNYSLSVFCLANGSYFCATDGCGEWIADTIDTAREWLAWGVGGGVVTPSLISTV